MNVSGSRRRWSRKPRREGASRTRAATRGERTRSVQSSLQRCPAVRCSVCAVRGERERARSSSARRDPRQHETRPAKSHVEVTQRFLAGAQRSRNCRSPSRPPSDRAFRFLFSAFHSLTVRRRSACWPQRRHFRDCDAPCRTAASGADCLFRTVSVALLASASRCQSGNISA